MAGQQQQILDTIFSMKRRILRNDDSSDSDDTEKLHGSQKQSLKRKAHYTRSGDLESLSNPQPYKKRIEHAGYRRYILQRNPPRFDPDGDIIEAADEYEEEDDLSTIEENPYADIQLEALLAPLTSPADLPNHPSYSVAYTSKHLTNLSKEAAFVSRKEQIALWHAKTLSNRLQGDSDFAPHALAAMAREPLGEFWASRSHAQELNGDGAQASRPYEQPKAPTQHMLTDKDVHMEDVAQIDGNTSGNNHEADVQDAAEPKTNGITGNTGVEKAQTNGDAAQSPLGDDMSDTASQQTAHRMTTRARAHAASSPSPPATPASFTNGIHPLFTFPVSSLPDKDFGLPPTEAEETRILLMAYVQKQEEIARMAADLSHGMMHGERMRQDVFKWSKAEAHIGEMSDGEDWYDEEEWGLDGQLGKGRDEEEDEAVAAGKKSTRQRRKPDREDR
ncbi:unnamed protein product [Periconia digitata]|uniref:Transcriptional regulatory protein RXT2 N-terminal domain-containing protein n=1 Tax=Periconia digitata TaxID=1303443 RepID=A0A9W4XPG3_9PLEO|nr:unnamed protein product [Periconia digitata]